MNVDEFWRLIDAARAGAGGEVGLYGDSLRKTLAPLTPEELVSFDSLFDEHLSRAYQWDLWGAAYLINGGCSDDGFVYFRAWLVMQGRDVYERALSDPDSLAEICDEPGELVECEEVLYIPADLFEEKTGSEMEPPGAGGHIGTDEPRGERWEEDDLTGLFPRLAAIHAGG
ncbi:MAG TPA: DUF4240 domain-containing protein [Pyrinomonadaceae bacterium]|nr:DUF4240 domain-containing protein [Pyrinomonadaceae bacterium]